MEKAAVIVDYYQEVSQIKYLVSNQVLWENK